MIKVDTGEINLNGRASELLAQLGIATCEIIKGIMEHDGITKEKAINMLYMSIQISIETYERNGEL